MEEVKTHHQIVRHGEEVRQVPWGGQSIDREWEFVLVLVGPAKVASVRTRSHHVVSKTHKLDSDALAHKLLVVEFGDGLHGVIVGLHHDETEASRLLGVRVVHDGSLVNLEDMIWSAIRIMDEWMNLQDRWYRRT